MRLSEIIKPNINVARSININRDRQNDFLMRDYHVTSKALEILGRFANSLEGEKVNAWSLTGPYGMGKSAYINFMLAITGNSNNHVSQIAIQKLKEVNLSLHNKLLNRIKEIAGNDGFFQIPITAGYESVNNTLARGLHTALENAVQPEINWLVQKTQALRNQRVINPQELFVLFQELQKIIKKPLLVVVDEFGKNLDYMSHRHDKGDIFIMQQLAEMDSVYIWVCLHQAFDEYASGLSAVQRREWSKVQGRFEDISFVESMSQMLYLMQKSLKQNQQGKLNGHIKKWSSNARQFVDGTFADNSKVFDNDTIASIYPLHPVTAIALIELCRRFAQHDRTLLTFMCSGDKYALPAFLNYTEIDTQKKLPAVGPDYLYDFFFNISTTAYINRAESQRWIEIHDIIDNAGYLSVLDQAILKNIGVFNLLSGILGVKASLSTITTVIEHTLGTNKIMVKESIDNLIKKGILLYREYAGEYRLWEGSDFDVYGAINNKKGKISVGSLDNILQDYLPLSPIIASRHAYQTGTVRRFERRWLSADSVSADLVPKEGFDGLFIYCYGTSVPDTIPVSCSDGRPLLIAFVAGQTTLHELALEVAATRSVLEEYPELIHDSVARKEIKFRIKVAEQQFRQNLVRLYSPGSEDLLWFSEGKQLSVKNSKDLSIKLSELCDSVYNKCPRIRNEMISCENLSSAAARARRELVEAMVTRASQKQLGLSGYGPEVAVYRSLLLAEGLHYEDKKSGYWRFTLEGKDPQLKDLWKVMDDAVKDAGDKGLCVFDILQILQAPPFGMRQGPAPIYICLYLLARTDEIAIFQEEEYRPYLTGSEMTLLIKRPELFVLKCFTSTPLEREVFKVYESILKDFQIKESPGLRNTTLLGVIGPLLNLLKDLPPYSKNTRELSLEAQRIRSAIRNSVEPMRLLFEELPEAVGIDIRIINEENKTWQNELRDKLHSALQELVQAYSKINKKVQETMLGVFNHLSIQELYESQRVRITPFVGICDEAELKPVLQAFARSYSDPADWVRGVAGIVSKKPLDSWNDQDYQPFTAKLYDYAERIRQLETLSTLSDNSTQKEISLLSLMMPDGRIKRGNLNLTYRSDSVVQSKANEILNLPEDKAKAILWVLAEKLFKSDANE